MMTRPDAGPRAPTVVGLMCFSGGASRWVLCCSSRPVAFRRFQPARRARGRNPACGGVPVAVVARNTCEDGRRAVAAALEAVRPDLVLAMSDQLAAGARDALDPAVRVCGWDNSDVAHTAGFPSVQQSLFDQGVACARIAAGLTTVVEPAEWSLALR